ncbi:MAG TPA: hypothetical protein DHU55_05290 [Blastocatellia bacterium]|jgi:hypothetical protein|nr:hypothetical protein [Blastocatellia bacterium]HCX29174.1 hypothetical protein [Blastocatellia bacterium]
MSIPFENQSIAIVKLIVVEIEAVESRLTEISSQDSTPGGRPDEASGGKIDSSGRRFDEARRSLSHYIERRQGRYFVAEIS